MLSLRKKIFIIAGVSIGFLISILLIIYLRGNQNDYGNLENGVNEQGLPLGQTGLNLQETGTFLPTNQVITMPGSNTQTQDEIYVKQLAKIFVERFNSYSNLNDNSHIDDAVALSTSRMVEWLNSQKIEQGRQYQGFTTEVFASNIENISSEKALVSFGAQQTTQSAGIEAPVLRSGFVKLAKISGEWKVDGFYWED